MKKVDLIHTTLLVVGILAGYNAMESLITMLSDVAYLGIPNFNGLERFLYDLILTVLYSAGSIILIRKGRYLSAGIMKDQGGGGDDGPSWNLDRHNMLFVLFIGIGLYVVVHASAFLISDLYDIYANKASAGRYRRVTIMNGVLIQLLRLTMGAFLIYAAPTLTNLIEKNIAVRLHRADKPESRPDSQQS
jgi:hypothetical protein